MGVLWTGWDAKVQNIASSKHYQYVVHCRVSSISPGDPWADWKLGLLAAAQRHERASCTCR